LASFNDWYLPSRDELNKLYLNRATIGVFENGTYLSSSQNEDPAKSEAPPGWGYVWGQDFLTGFQLKISKSDEVNYVRAVRSF
jgi:hypothetical protein